MISDDIRFSLFKASRKRSFPRGVNPWDNSEGARDTYAEFVRKEAVRHKDTFVSPYPWSPVECGFPSFLSFSSFSPALCDGYRHDHLVRPYQIVVFPDAEFVEPDGFQILSGLWIPDEHRLDKPTVLWDGFSKIALFEIIYECVHPICLNPEQVRVYDVKNKVYVDDPRSQENLASRPSVPDASRVFSGQESAIEFWIRRFDALYKWALNQAQVASLREDPVRMDAWRQAVNVFGFSIASRPFSHPDYKMREKAVSDAVAWGFTSASLASRPWAKWLAIDDSPDLAFFRLHGRPLQPLDLKYG